MASTAAETRFEIEESPENGFRLKAFGPWTLSAIGAVDSALHAFSERAMGRELEIDLAGVSRLDTAGAFVLQRTLAACGSRTEVSQFSHIPDGADLILQRVGRSIADCDIEPPRVNAFVLMLNRLGRGVVDAYYSAAQFFGFVGVVLVALSRLVVQPRRFRSIATVHHMEEAGLNAVPIVALLSFMIGAVVAFMGAKILAQFGAEVFTVQLVGIAVMREFGVLITAILVAGRSGSAFTAAIGSMKLREEIDAMRTLGLDPTEVLVLPRVVALMAMTPILVFLAIMVGVVGGLLVCWFSLDISPSLFMAQTQETVAFSNFWVGMAKTPFFAFVIAVIGCHQGMKTEGGAESLGERTTLSVVQSIFTVIVLDAFFAMFFLELDV